MKIGLKYCGGCNPRYDRKNCVDRMIAEHAECTFESPQWGQRYGTILLVCGCERSCLRHYDTVEADHYVLLTKPEEFSGITLV